MPDAEKGCRFIWTVDAKPTRRCVTHEYDWRPPYEPMCPGTRVTPSERARVMTADRDALARAIGTPTCRGTVYVANPATREGIADQILDSDWLLERDARIAAEARKAALEEAAQAIEAARDQFQRVTRTSDSARACMAYDDAVQVVRSIGGTS